MLLIEFSWLKIDIYASNGEQGHEFSNSMKIRDFLKSLEKYLIMAFVMNSVTLKYCVSICLVEMAKTTRKRKHPAPIPLHSIISTSLSNIFAWQLQEYCEDVVVSSALQ
jgi:hypothetical protein